MKKFAKVIAFAIVALVLIAVVGIGYITMFLPNVGKPEDVKIAITPERIARGEYLANHITLCTDCHSYRDWSKRSRPVDPGKLDAGGILFDEGDNVPGKLYSPNITPFALKNWSDGQILRAITTGESQDGHALFPLMPWQNFSKMDREDLYAIIAYLRTLHPLQTAPYPAHQLNFPTNIIVHLIPQKASFGKLPPESDTVAYGGYLVNAAGCIFCHSQSDKGNILPGMEFAGGVSFRIGGKTVISANITPDKNTGIGNWTQQVFLARFNEVRDTSGEMYKHADKYITVMPWYDYAGMKQNDLKSIYAYLHSRVKPVSHKVNTW